MISAILACPQCKGKIHSTETGEGFICRSCSLIYPIRNGIPVMLIAEAQPVPVRATDPS
ncbi:MAG: Trm112 family protein [Nitrospiraceae bacterium]|jgi:uncharacterized protein YbaR (Trm112 family)|nr:Trm112 family protein [Nitrospiraceae bacterium]